jgi:hypothetical protein
MVHAVYRKHKTMLEWGRGFEVKNEAMKKIFEKRPENCTCQDQTGRGQNASTVPDTEVGGYCNHWQENGQDRDGADTAQAFEEAVILEHDEFTLSWSQVLWYGYCCIGHDFQNLQL